MINELNDARQRLDDLAKSSNRLGVASEKLGGLAFAAELAGVFHLQDVDIIEQIKRSAAEQAKGQPRGGSGFLSGLPKVGV